MKKLVSIFLSVMIILGVFSISAFADNTEAKYYYDKFADAEEYTMKVRTFNAEAGKELPLFVCRKGNVMVIESELPIEDVELFCFQKIRVVVDDEKIKMFFPLIPIFCFEIPSDKMVESIEGVVDLESELSFIGSSEVVVDGKKCIVESFLDEDGNTIKYTFCDEEPKSIVVTDPNGILVAEMIIEEFSYKAEWYHFITPLLVIPISDDVMYAEF